MNQTAETKYPNAFHRERPVHGEHDEFSMRHPKMTAGRRAKIFSPFAALRGYEEAIEGKLETYVGKAERSEEDQARINQVLLELAELTENSRRTGTDPIVASVTFYVPCGDENHEAYGRYGRYETLTGPVRKVDPTVRKAIRMEERMIEFSDIADIRIETRPGEVE